MDLDDELRQRMQALHRILAGQAAIAEAELAAFGIHPVTVITGYMESDYDVKLRSRIAAAADEYHARMCVGGKDHVTYLFCDQADAAGFMAEVTGWPALPSWWQITATAQPVYDR